MTICTSSKSGATDEPICGSVQSQKQTPPGLAPLRFFGSLGPFTAGLGAAGVLVLEPIPSRTRGRLEPQPCISWTTAVATEELRREEGWVESWKLDPKSILR
jgi:hypothetical protein